MPLSFSRRTWLEISLSALRQNYRAACGLAAPCARVACVLKANAYGLGAVRVAQALADEGVAFFAVSSVREGLQLRRAGIGGTILVMGAAEAELLPAALAAELTLTVFDEASAHAIAQAARTLGEPADVHVKLDTGFHRLGFAADDAHIKEVVARIAGLRSEPYLLIQGIFAHLSLRTPEDDARQAARLHAVCTGLQAVQAAPPLVHLVDSIGLARYPQWHHDLVRVGALLYGAPASDCPVSIAAVVRFKTVITRLHWAEAGAYIGYDEDAPLPRRTLVATLPTGYGDGYPRAMGGVASVAIRGLLCPVLGRVCMDQIMVDASAVPGVTTGDEVTLLGDNISLPQYAAWAGTNRNEALARFTARPLRVYYENDTVVAVDDALLP